MTEHCTTMTTIALIEARQDAQEMSPQGNHVSRAKNKCKKNGLRNYCIYHHHTEILIFMAFIITLKFQICTSSMRAHVIAQWIHNFWGMCEWWPERRQRIAYSDWPSTGVVSAYRFQTSVTDRFCPYPDSVWWYCIPNSAHWTILFVAKKRPNKINRDTTHVNKKHGCLKWCHKLAIFEYNGSREMVAGLRQGFLWVQMQLLYFLYLARVKKRCYYKLLVYKLFLQRTYSDTHVSLR